MITLVCLPVNLESFWTDKEEELWEEYNPANVSMFLYLIPAPTKKINKFPQWITTASATPFVLEFSLFRLMLFFSFSHRTLEK